jgi:hypothetical protein
MVVYEVVYEDFYSVIGFTFYEFINIDGLVKSRKLNFSPQDVGHKIEKATISCGQNKMLGLFTSTSILTLITIPILHTYNFDIQTIISSLWS